MRRTIILTIAIMFGLTAFSKGYKVGDKASGFNLLNVDGKMVSLENYGEANGFIVIFTCNHCPFSVAYEDRINELNSKFSSKGWPVIAINPNDSTIVPGDSYSNMQIRTKEKNFTFPYLLDADQSIAKTYGATRTPHVYVLQKEDRDLIVKYIGAIDDNHEDPDRVRARFTEEAVDALIADKTPNPEFTKAIGCTIKYSK